MQRYFPASCAKLFTGSSLFPRARVFITKVPLYFNDYFAKICGFVAKRLKSPRVYGFGVSPEMVRR
jgi:hypothetical protein